MTISRSIYINRRANWGRWRDAFTNTTNAPLTIKVAFGGQSGIGSSGGELKRDCKHVQRGYTRNPSRLRGRGCNPVYGTTLPTGPQVTVLGTPTAPAQPFRGAMTFAGDWLNDTFKTPLSDAAHERNFQAYVNLSESLPEEACPSCISSVLGERVTQVPSRRWRTALRKRRKSAT